VTCGTSAWSLRRNLLVDPEVLLDRGDANFELEALVDFALLEFRQLRAQAINVADEGGLDAINLCLEFVEARIEPGDVILGRHVLNNMREHLADFLECGLLRCCHYPASVPQLPSPRTERAAHRTA
jgi:hypothetical protein